MPLTVFPVGKVAYVCDDVVADPASGKPLVNVAQALADFVQAARGRNPVFPAAAIFITQKRHADELITEKARVFDHAFKFVFHLFNSGVRARHRKPDFIECGFK